jgi:hypothetical protein
MHSWPAEPCSGIMMHRQCCLWAGLNPWSQLALIPNNMKYTWALVVPVLCYHNHSFAGSVGSTHCGFTHGSAWPIISLSDQEHVLEISFWVLIASQYDLEVKHAISGTLLPPGFRFATREIIIDSRLNNVLHCRPFRCFSPRHNQYWADCKSEIGPWKDAWISIIYAYITSRCDISKM